jgi:hypothetical protein
MKHLVKDGQIVMSGVPSIFERENGQLFYGGYENMTDLHYSDDWRDEVIPEYDPIIQSLGEPYYNSANDIVTYSVVDKHLDLAIILQKRLSEFEDFQKSFRREITELYLEEIALGTLSEDVKRFIVLLQERKVQIIAELQGFYNAGNIERLLNYSFYTEEAEQFKMALTMLKD